MKFGKSIAELVWKNEDEQIDQIITKSPGVPVVILVHLYFGYKWALTATN
jgi:hypothetical protein